MVVNPGFAKEGDVAAEEYRRTKEHDLEFANNPVPCILFFDSLKAHGSRSVGNKVRKWLTSEWQRRQQDTFSFSESNLPVITPKSTYCYSLRNPCAHDACLSLSSVPEQTNGCDCGVFVCRYAYAMYLMRNETFTYESAGMAPGDISRRKMAFRSQITESAAFDFDMSDIATIRDHVAELIKRLHVLYVPWRKQQLEKIKAERRQAKLAEREKAAAAASTASEASAGKDNGEKPAAKVTFDESSVARNNTGKGASGVMGTCAIDVQSSQESTVPLNETGHATMADSSVAELLVSSQSETVVEVVTPREDSIEPALSSIVYPEELSVDLSDSLSALRLKENQDVSQERNDQDAGSVTKPASSAAKGPPIYEAI